MPGAAQQLGSAAPGVGSVRERLRSYDWPALRSGLHEHGFARLPGLLRPSECDAVRALYDEPRRFRKHVDLARHRFGDKGDYRYFANPLPRMVRSLRTACYARLAPVANSWAERLRLEERYPASLGAFLARCHAAGQTRPTPLVLRYDAGGYNCLHQDRYGRVAFPLQVVVLLSRPGRDFRGGELLLVEQRPRMQSRGTALALEQGEAVVFTNAERPVASARGYARARMRHGVSPLLDGERFTLGIIFHDAA